MLQDGTDKGEKERYERCALAFMMPFQLSPVAIRNRVRKAIPKFWKWACLLSPSQGWTGEHSEWTQTGHIKTKQNKHIMSCTVSNG